MTNSKPLPWFEPAGLSDVTGKNAVYVDVYVADKPSPEEYERRVKAALSRAGRGLSAADTDLQSPTGEKRDADPASCPSDAEHS